MAGPVFVADPPDQTRTVELDGLTAVFHIPSATTHVLAPPAPQIMEILGGCPLTAGQLLARIRARFDLAPGEDEAASLAARLAELEAAGLVRQQ